MGLESGGGEEVGSMWYFLNSFESLVFVYKKNFNFIVGGKRMIDIIISILEMRSEIFFIFFIIYF